ncbi:adaptor protein MecA [uncultured Limosilactobacillus sp.]|uniref:adaptor protein MecA n=1 Tax=uncultured Limosilactobacillus sp. TaxID=2837629 RepID=UPI0025D39948|nr:adaptor protein MecA [uncultured Limosilactobacillus sp.]
MEKRQLDENTIQVIINQDDLEARGISMLDLIGNQKQIEDFFYSILEEVDTEHQFQRNDSVTFQALPIKNGLELIISKNVNKGTNSGMNQVSKLIADQLRGHDQRNYSNNRNTSINNDEKAVVSDTFVVKFADFENIIELANVLNEDNLSSDLYHYHKKFYLVIKNLDNVDLAKETMLNYQAIASEYGQIVDFAPSLLQEHGKLIMRQSALDTTKYYFN